MADGWAEEGIPDWLFQEEVAALAPVGANDCSICLEPMDANDANNPLFQLACPGPQPHVFHQHCIFFHIQNQQNNQNQPLCPLCNGPIVQQHILLQVPAVEPQDIIHAAPPADEPDICIICQHPVDNPDPNGPPWQHPLCVHRFHQNCVPGHFSINPTCPLCMAPTEDPVVVAARRVRLIRDMHTVVTNPETGERVPHVIHRDPRGPRPPYPPPLF